jgi:tRNA-specific 2-thiouridylase
MDREQKNCGRALIAMSGGVDSSVAAYLMQRAGYDCIGVTMRLYENETVGLPRAHTCCSLDDVEDARSVAFRLGMPYYVFNFASDFAREVIDRFVQSYAEGRTPNPCIDCNRFLKFERLYRRMRELGLDALATGHYARVQQSPETGRWLLKKAVDPAKDQSYVLYSLTQEQLAHVRFPLGELHKSETRALAEQQGFCNAHKHDSQDICFVPDGDYAAFLERWRGAPCVPGNFVDGVGRVLGRHKGIEHYTVGQHKGLGITSGEPLYVCGLCAATHTVHLGRSAELLSHALDADHINLISCAQLDGPRRVSVRVRYHQPEQTALVTQTGPDTLHIVFDVPQRAVTPGQAVVLYEGDTVLGGGTILNSAQQ